MTRLIIFILLVFLVYTLWTALTRSLRGRQNNDQPSAPRSRRGEDLVQDPHCGTYVPRSEALEAQIGGHRHIFWSAACRDAFRDKN